MQPLEDTVLAALRELPRIGRLLVAYSGGLDSTVLLHVCATARPASAAPLAAIHVDHGLHRESAAWAAHCRAVCDRLGVPLTVLSVDAAAARAARGVEAAAREARYAALAGLLGPGDCLLAAHHRDDQAETVLLQLLRGSGPAGLAAMPAVAPLGRGLLVRPLLDVARAELRRHAEAAGLAWLDDPTNRDPSLGRGWLRTEVLPALRARHPGADAALARAARHCADASAIVDERAADDLDALATASPWQLDAGSLLRLSPARRRAALRHWCVRQGVPVPDTARLDEFLGQVATAAAASAPQVEWPGGALRRYRDRVYLDRGLAPPPGAQPVRWDGESPLRLPAALGVLEVAAGGLPGRGALGPAMEVGFRTTGLRVALAGRPGRHTLKNLFQEAGVPPWLRPRVPVLWVGGEPAAVGDRWVCAPFAGPGDGAGLTVRWQRPDPLSHWSNAPARPAAGRGHGHLPL